MLRSAASTAAAAAVRVVVGLRVAHSRQHSLTISLISRSMASTAAPSAPSTVTAPNSSPKAPWREEFDRAQKRNGRNPLAKWPQLATVRPDGKPASRYIVQRGYFGDSDRLAFVTDLRTEKIKELRHNPWVTACYYLPDTREQFRFEGKMSIIGPDAEDQRLRQASINSARIDLWGRMSDNTRTQFAWPHPGLERTQNELHEGPAPPADEPPTDVFGVLTLDVESVDYLSLRQNRRHKWRMAVEGDSSTWTKTEVNP
eukprot:jgi/Chlat1/3837/Chrsp26S03975